MSDTKTYLVKQMKCDIGEHFGLNHELTNNTIYDAQVHDGRWAWLCEKCFRIFGKGLGMGLGQKFVRAENSERWVLTEGGR